MPLFRNNFPVFLAFLCSIFGRITSYSCLDVTSCDCRREGDWLEGDKHGYHVIDCTGDIDIREMNFSAFKHNEELYNFTFSNTTLKHFNSSFLRGINVYALRIDNQTLQVDERAFASISQTLKHLSLINVNISKKWKLDFLTPLKDLQSLIFDENGIYPEEFRNPVFQNYSLASLKYLSLRGCKILIMSAEALDGLPNLETLDLSHNIFPMVPDAILLLKNLRKLNLSYNKRLSYVQNYAFKGLTRLEEIDLSHTDLSTIADMAFANLENSLNILDLHNAKLQDGHFDSMKELKKLHRIDMSYNNIVEMHNTSFEGFISLEELDISGQSHVHNGRKYNLAFIDSVFKGIEKKLKHLRIRKLGLTSLPLAALKTLTNLQTLDASENEFQEIYEDFFYGVKAKTIYLMNMGIYEVSSEAFNTMKPGLNIYFDSNNITNISFILDTPKCLFEKVSLFGNPIQCTCDVIEIAATNRIPQFMGTCADTFYKEENLQTIHKLSVAKTNCKTRGYKNVIQCSHLYTNYALRTAPLSTSFLLSIHVGILYSYYL